MMCAMCGKETDLFIAKVEGTELKVCKECARFGKIIREVKPPVIEKKKKFVEHRNIEDEPEKIEMVVEDYPRLIRNRREKMNLKQKDFAKMLNEKESIIQNIETGKYTPSLELARKFEKALKIKLIEEYVEEKRKKSSNESTDYTIGDMIKIKK